VQVEDGVILVRGANNRKRYVPIKQQQSGWLWVTFKVIHLLQVFPNMILLCNAVLARYVY